MRSSTLTVGSLARHLGKRTQAIREAAGMSRVELAKKLNYSETVIKNIEAGWYGAMRLYDVHRLAVALGVEVSELVPKRLVR